VSGRPSGQESEAAQPEPLLESHADAYRVPEGKLHVLVAETRQNTRPLLATHTAPLVIQPVCTLYTQSTLMNGYE
jgi:hypothetical protein